MSDFVGRRTVSLRRAASFANGLLGARLRRRRRRRRRPRRRRSAVRPPPTYVYGQPRRRTPRNCYRCARNGSINAERRWSGVEADGARRTEKANGTAGARRSVKGCAKGGRGCVGVRVAKVKRKERSEERERRRCETRRMKERGWRSRKSEEG